jgi:hypothetical protein
MIGNNKGFNVAWSLKQFLAAVRDQDDEFTICPWQLLKILFALEQTYKILGTELNSISDMMLSLTNINGKLMIHISQDSGQFKRGRSKHCVYLKNERVYINKAQLGE